MECQLQNNNIIPSRKEPREEMREQYAQIFAGPDNGRMKQSMLVAQDIHYSERGSLLIAGQAAVALFKKSAIGPVLPVFAPQQEGGVHLKLRRDSSFLDALCHAGSETLGICKPFQSWRNSKPGIDLDARISRDSFPLDSRSRYMIHSVIIISHKA